MIKGLQENQDILEEEGKTRVVVVFLIINSIRNEWKAGR